MSASSRDLIVVKTNQRVGTLSGGHRWRWSAERARKHVESHHGAGPNPCSLRTVRDGRRWAVVAFQNYATDNADMASWITALDVELGAGAITEAEFASEVRRYSDALKAVVR